jgi:sugar phosphate isomerase/epimerase
MRIRNHLRFGVVQGRLIQSPLGQLQWFPQDFWESEFFLAASLKLDYIEFIAEREHNPSNPIWSTEGINKIQFLAQLNKLSLYSFCNDYIINHNLYESEDTLNQCLRLLNQGYLIGCKKYILPLFEKSELTLNNSSKYIPSLKALADKAQEYGIDVCLETTLNGLDLIELINRINHPAISVVYDTGNRIAFGHDLSSDIKILGKHISHVHIKDKNKDNVNVLLGTGLVNFFDVFEALAEIKYTGTYTFETHRGKNPLCTMRHNKTLINFFHSENQLN